MVLKEKTGFHLCDRVLRSTISPWGENKRGEFMQVVPPPSPRQRGTSSESASIIPLVQKQSGYSVYSIQSKKLPL